jgi:hypothetical protein
MIVDVGFAGVFPFEVLVRYVRVVDGGVAVLVLVGGAQVLEATGHLVVVVRHVEVPMAVYQAFVIVLFPFLSGCVLRHRSLLGARRGSPAARPSYPAPVTACSRGGVPRRTVVAPGPVVA